MNNEGLDDKRIEENKDSNEEKGNSNIFVSRKVKILYYISIFIISLLLSKYFVDFQQSYTLGDFGTLIPLLFNLVIMQTLKWCPIFCIIGLILTFLDKQFKELNTVFFIIVGFLIVLSGLLILVVKG